MNQETRTAFPDGSTNEWGKAISGGMTLREYYTAKAMQGILSNPLYFSELQNQAVELDLLGHPTNVFKLVAELSQDMADTLLSKT
jgi:hypothetical protein